MLPAPTIRPALPEETARLRRFLPGAFPGPEGVRFLVAASRAEEAPSPERFVAAAALWAGSPGGDVCFTWRLTPRAESENDGAVARALLDTLRRRAAEEFPAAPALRTAAVWPEDGATSRLLAAAGGETVVVNEVWELDAETLWRRVDALCRRLPPLPAGVRIAPLAPPWFAAAGALVAAHGLMDPGLLEHRLRLFGQPGGFARGSSAVLLVGGKGGNDEVAGVGLTRLTATTLEMDARVVRPDLRRGGAQTRALRTGLAAWRAAGGGSLVRFRSDREAHRETANFARRGGGRRVGRELGWRLPLPGRPAPRPGV